MQLDPVIVDNIILAALKEDVGKGDITTELTISQEKLAHFAIRARHAMTACGVNVAMRVFELCDPELSLRQIAKEGEKLESDDVIIQGRGHARAILTAERVALNLLRQMCGVATLTTQFVEKIQNYPANIYDTRKTVPGLRYLQKYAVATAGGANHRWGLDDAILIKDNHISACGSISKALEQVKQFAPENLTVEIECDTLEQVKESLPFKPDIILLDNMSIEDITAATKLVNGDVELEVSGNVNLDNVEDIAKTGVSRISSGMLTNSPVPVDIGLDFDW